jgi:serine/threonine protein kinase/Flp pilus assembly protein TadD
MSQTEESVFVEALAQNDPQERVAYLDRACAGDTALRRNIEELLSAYEAGQFLETPAAALIDTVTDAIPPSPGVTLGAYQLRERIGEGGCGLVFRAEQLHPVRREVALKVIKPGMDSQQVIARFDAERQALALMEHPHIARVLDAGQSPSGRPYFVMELVRGLPITDHCDQANATIRERLELFISVCEAVRHAHQKGIIHRDLKPSNVLVAQMEGAPVVKVIDFGVAKALGRKLTDKTMATGLCHVIGTPLYMSPEQIEPNAPDVDTRADIYALGVLLYELLAGTTPFDRQRLYAAGYDEMRRIVRDEEPPRPSTRIGMSAGETTIVAARRRCHPRRLSQLVRGELDWIVMKALEKDRNRRYETADALAADVRRHLNDEPVSAGPPTAWYRCRKFARRYRRSLATAAVVLVALVAAVAAIAGSIGWAARDRAARDAALCTAVEGNLDQVEALLKDGKWPEASAAMDRAVDLLKSASRPQRPGRLERLQQDIAMARRLEEIYGQPRDLLFFSGREQDGKYAAAFREYGIDPAALAVAEAAERIRGRSIRRELARALDFWSSMRRRARNELAPDWRQLLEVARAADPDPWRDRLRAALQNDDRQALEALAASADVQKLPPETLTLLGRTLAEFLESPGQAAALLRQAQQQHPGDLWINDALGWLYLNFIRPPQYDEAARFYTAALAIRPDTPFLAHGVGLALREKGAARESVGAFSKAIQLDPALATAWSDRGCAHLRLQEWQDAVSDCSEAIRLDPRLAIARVFRGEAYIAQGDWEEAAADYDRAVELAPDDPWSWYPTAALHLYLGNTREYRRICRDVLRRFPNNETPEIAGSVTMTCSLAPLAVDDFGPVLEFAERAVAGDEQHPGYRWFALARALAEYRAGHHLSAAGWFERFGPRTDGAHFDATAFAIMALAQQRLERPDAARVALGRARAILDEKMPDPRAGRGFGPDWPYRPHDCHDWLHAAILCREAEALLGIENKTVDDEETRGQD